MVAFVYHCTAARDISVSAVYHLDRADTCRTSVLHLDRGRFFVVRSQSRVRIEEIQQGKYSMASEMDRTVSCGLLHAVSNGNIFILSCTSFGVIKKIQNAVMTLSSRCFLFLTDIFRYGMFFSLLEFLIKK